MNDIQSKEFQNRYKKSKYKVKQWEDKFLAENGRFPTKADIKSSPVSVKEYYKLYWKLKTQILEAEILGESKSPEVLSLSNLNASSVVEVSTDLNKTVEISEDKEKDFNDTNSPSTSKENINNTNTWGSHLNKSKSTTTLLEKEKSGLLNDVVAGRLFKGSSFKKRNPRKAPSFSKKKSNKSEDKGKSFESFELGSVASPFSDITQDVLSSFDQSLNESVFSVENDISPNIKALITSSASLSPLLNKSGNVTVEEDKVELTVQPVSLIQMAASDPNFESKSVRSLDSSWVERCGKSVSKEERKSSSDSGFDSMEGSLQDSKEEETAVGESSDDDIIAGSDTEQDNNSTFLSQKRKLDASSISIDESSFQLPKKKVKVDADLPSKEEVKKTILERKVAAGTLNENYVKINLKKKVFVRGKRNFNYGKFKKQEWKNKKKSLDDGRESGGLVQCWKCGETGHFSRYCEKKGEDKLLSDDGEDEDEGLPTLEEAEKMAKERAEKRNCKKKNILDVEKPVEETQLLPKVEPLYKLKEDSSTIPAPQEVYEALEKFGHLEFRPGQEDAIMRILSGQSTLLTLTTGGGKSLCYQLPAYLYFCKSKCITLVVSPLVSLMEDQVTGSSSFFKVGCYHTSQTQKQRENVLNDAKNGKLCALLVSPEAVTSGDVSGFKSILHQLPPIAFACIDEVHCLSQWSHNFRPSYLMITKVLKEKFGISTILGLTATATLSTIQSITKELGISDHKGVIKDIPLPDNLCLSVSRDENKDRALIQLLKGPRFKDAKAIIIYCTRRDECERLAVMIRTVLQSEVQEEKKISKRLSWNAESYHAGMAAARRKQVQKAFMCGNLRIVVATVAFGMGINKQDIRGVIHYNMPKDFESYVQEVGRAGRDGKPAFCHLFLNSNGSDLNELRRHIHANSIDRYVLRKLLQRVFIECDCRTKDESKQCEGHEVAFDCTSTIQALDIPAENIYTLLYYLELHPKKFIQVLSPVYTKCKIKSYKGKKGIIKAAKKCPPLAYACATCRNWTKEKSEVLEFDVIELSNKINWGSSLVKSQLKNIEWEMSEESKWRKTGISVEFSDLGFRVCSRGDLTSSELDEALDFLTQRVEDQEKKLLSLLDISFSTFDHFSHDSHENFDREKCEELKLAVRRYFEREEIQEEIPVKKVETEDFDEEALAADVRVLLCTYRDNTFNGRSVARIFHGIQSPNYPASLWFKCRFWRKHIDKDFKKISQIATREILRLK